MKILVTGGAGFIGSHLVDKLIKKGHKLVVIDNLSTGRKRNLNPEAKFYKIDIQDQGISQIFKKEKPEIVFHYAAQTSVRKSIKNPAEDANINILGSLNLLKNCQKSKVKKFIFASSVGVYGEPQKLPVKESHFLNPTSPYPITKLTFEKYLYYYQKQGLNFIALRYSNIYGPRQSNEGEAGVIAIFINKFLKNEKPTILGKGEQTRDFLYVDDAVLAAVKTLKASPGSIYPVRNSISNGVYNVGTNQEITINHLFKILSSKFQKRIKPSFSSSPPGEIIKSRVDFGRIKKELGWKPQYSLDQGLEKTIKWFTERS